MPISQGKARNTFKVALLSASLLTGFAAFGVSAQDAAPTAPAADESETIVVVTGYRGSLQSSTAAKKRDVGFSDSIFAEDIGKFPDTNIAESFNRIPGINISREVTGEGVNIAIRGLGTSFTRVLLNGSPVAVASTGSTDSQNTNREVDLDLLPTELFTQLTVSKSPTASLIEGGASGTVNMRQARPFDHKGNQLVYSAGTMKSSEADDYGYKASLLASGIFGKFGILGGISTNHTEMSVSGFETVGWTNAGIGYQQCGHTPPVTTPVTSPTANDPACNNTGGGNWTIPGTVPANAGNGLTPGTLITPAFLLANNPGLTMQQISNGLIPRLGRPMNEYGSKDRTSAILSLEYRPADNVRFYLDSIYAHKKNDLQRTDMNWVGRNGAMIPLNMKVDNSDCSDGCVVTEGTFANAQFFLEYRPHIEETDFKGVNPGFEWDINDRLKLTASANWNKSTFHRESPSFLVITPASSGVTVNYKNDGGIPVMESNVDLNDPANFVWDGGRVNIQDERRETEVKGARFDLKWGDSAFNIQTGMSYDDTSRSIKAYDNSQAWQNATCGNNPSLFLPSPNSQPACKGQVITNTAAAIAAGYPSYPGLGTEYSQGAAPLTYAGSLVPQSALAGYLQPGPYGYITVDWDKFAKASNYQQFHDSAPEAGSSNTGASGGYIREKVQGAYIQVNGDRDLFGAHRLRYNFGIRAITTEQTIGGMVSIPDPRNTPPSPPAPAPAVPPLPDGAKYPNIVNFATTNTTYKNYLPSLNLAYNAMDNLIVRFAKSTTMTRANPNTMLPGLSFSTPSADAGNVGNPSLKPYISDNTDFGLEYYTGKEGYVSVTLFNKKIDGFTQNGSVTVPFTNLATYGVTYDTLTPTQKDAIDARGGANAATVVLTQQVNSGEVITIKGTEFNWVQPLGQWWQPLDGFGFSANMTLIDQKSTNPATIATGVPKKTYNFTGYYEKHGYMIRVSDTYRDGSQSSGFNQNGIANAALFADSYDQWDLSSSIDLGEVFNMPHGPQLTLDVINLNGATLRSYYQFPNATFTYYKPGTTVMLGVRGRF